MALPSPIGGGRGDASEGSGPESLKKNARKPPNEGKKRNDGSGHSFSSSIVFQALTATKVEKAKPGRYGDGNGLYLLVRPEGGRWWVFRWVRNGKMREIGLGPAPGRAANAAAVTLAEARLKAGALLKQVRDGIDPLDQREAQKAEARAEVQREVVARISFRAVAEKYIPPMRRVGRTTSTSISGTRVSAPACSRTWATCR